MKRSSFVIFLIFCLLSVASCSSEPRSATDYEVWGVDVSRHQSAINWDKVLEKDKPHFVFVKATEGTLIKDATYEKNRLKLKGSEVLWGAYHFFGHRTSGKEQAKNFISTAKLEKGNLIPVLDIEWHRFFKDKYKMVREAKAFCKEIKSNYGVYPIIYCSTLFYERYLKEAFPEDDYVLWIADYRAKPDGIDWHFWQHTDSYSLKGFGSGVDRNVFGGDYEQLKKLVLR